MLSDPICLRVKGPFACFTRPEFHVERVSYPVITPSAARGILEAILMKPIEKPGTDKRHNKVGFRWAVTRIGVLKRGTFFSILRNEVQSGEGTNQNLRDGLSTPKLGYDVSSAASDRSQRHSLILRDVEYLIEARIEVPAFGGRALYGHLKKYEGIFRRRAQAGQCYYQPFLGCREFSANEVHWMDKDRSGKEWALPDADKQRMAAIDGDNGDFGLLFHDFDFQPIWDHWPSLGREAVSPRPAEWPEFGDADPVSPHRLSGFRALAVKGWITVPPLRVLKSHERSNYFADQSR
jgi:CRISPR-associated protein Cas5d